MVRKKQQNPRALLGPPEARQNTLEADVSTSLTAALPAHEGRSGRGAPDLSNDSLQFVTVVATWHSDLLPLEHLQIDCTDLTHLCVGGMEPLLRLSLTSDLRSSAIDWAVETSTSGDHSTFTVSASCAYIVRKVLTSCCPWLTHHLNNSLYTAAGHSPCFHTVGC